MGRPKRARLARFIETRRVSEGECAGKGFGAFSLAYASGYDVPSFSVQGICLTEGTTEV